MSRSHDRLIGKQKRFVEEYLVDLNATRAAKRAGYSKRTAAVIGARTLHFPHVAAVINAAIAQRSKDLECSAAWVINEFFTIAKDRDNDAQTRLRALENLGKHFGIYKAEAGPRMKYQLTWIYPTEAAHAAGQKVIDVTP